MLIDVRGDTMQEILAQRIPGALSLALPGLEKYSLEQLRGHRVVLYCTCPNEASAAAGVRILRARGHANAQALRGGLDAWIQAGHEIETCRADMSVDTQPAPDAIGAPERPSRLEV